MAYQVIAIVAICSLLIVIVLAYLDRKHYRQHIEILETIIELNELESKSLKNAIESQNLPWEDFSL